MSDHVQADWIKLPNKANLLREIYEVENAKTVFQNFRAQVNTSPNLAALEGYEGAYKALCKAYGLNDKKTYSLSIESFTTPAKGRNAFTKAIDENIETLDRVVKAAFEDYASDIREDFDELDKQYRKAVNKLSTTDADMDAPNKKTITVNHLRVWEMFHVRKEFRGKDALQMIRTESERLERLVKAVDRGLQRIAAELKTGEKLNKNSRDLPNVDKTWFMFNRWARIEGSQFDWGADKVPKHKKELSFRQHVVIILSNILFGNFGGQLAKSFTTPEDSPAKVDRSLSEVHKFVRTVTGLEDLADDLADLVKEIETLFKNVSEENESALNRRIAPLMDVVVFVMKQITEITYGTDRIFAKLIREN